MRKIVELVSILNLIWGIFALDILYHLVVPRVVFFPRIQLVLKYHYTTSTRMNPVFHEFSHTRYSSSREYISAHSTVLQYHLQVFSTPEDFPDLTVSYDYCTSKLNTRYFQLQTCMAFCIEYQQCLDLSHTWRTTVMV